MDLCVERKWQFIRPIQHPHFARHNFDLASQPFRSAKSVPSAPPSAHCVAQTATSTADKRCACAIPSPSRLIADQTRSAFQLETNAVNLNAWTSLPQPNLWARQSLSPPLFRSL